MLINIVNKYCQNTVSYCRKIIPSIEKPIPPAAILKRFSLSERTQQIIDVLHHTALVEYSEDRIDITKVWKYIKNLLYMGTINTIHFLNQGLDLSAICTIFNIVSALNSQQILTGYR